MAGSRVYSWNAVTRSGYPGFLHIFFLFLFVILVAAPLVPLLVDTVQYAAADPGSVTKVVMPTVRVAVLLANSVALAFAVSGAATGAGVMAGTWLWGHSRGPGGYIPWILLIFIPVPATLYYFAWSSFFPLTGWIAAWAIQVMMYLPLLTVFSYIGLRLVDREKIEAGKIGADDVTIYRHIILPLAAPLILAGSGLVFIFSLLDYTVPSLCSVNVYALEIFARFSASNRAAEAFLLSLPLIAVAGAAVFFSQHHIKKAFQNVSWERTRPAPLMAWPGWFSRLTAAAAGVTILGTGFVLVFLAVSAFTGQTVPWGKAIYGDLLFSFATALIAAILCLAPAMAAAREMSGFTRGSGFWWGISMIPLAIPAALAGIGFTIIAGIPLLEPCSRGISLPVLVSIFRFIPIAAIVLCAQLCITDRSLIEAGQVFSTGIIDEWRKIRLPLFFPGICMAGYLVFAFTLGELGGTLMVVPPGTSTITIRLYNYLHYGASGSVAQLSLLLAGLVILSGVVFLLVLYVLRRPITRKRSNKEKGDT